MNVKVYDEIKVTVRQFLTKPNDKKPGKKPVPMRTMFGYLTQETDKAVYVHLKGKPMPSSVCLHCGRSLDHPVSVLYGIGPICGGHFHINPLNSKEELDKAMEDIRKNLSDVTWSGWLPKSAIEVEMTGEQIEVREDDKPDIQPKADSVPISEKKTNSGNDFEGAKVDDSLVKDLIAELGF